MNCVVHLNGWPGSGKRTIGAALAELMGGRLLDNHVMLNPAETLFDRRDPLHASLRDAVRAITLDYAARLAPGVTIILTDPLADDAVDAELFESFRRLAQRRNARLISVIIDIAREENLRRLLAPGRSGQRKLTDPAVLQDLRDTYELLVPRDVEAIRLDVSRLSAAEAAAEIFRRIETASSSGEE